MRVGFGLVVGLSLISKTDIKEGKVKQYLEDAQSKLSSDCSNFHTYFFFIGKLVFSVVPLLKLLPSDNLKIVCLSEFFILPKNHIKIDALSRISVMFLMYITFDHTRKIVIV